MRYKRYASEIKQEESRFVAVINVKSSSLSRTSVEEPPSLSLCPSSLLAQSESNRPHPPTIHSFTPRLEIYERIVATPLIIALAFAFVYSKKAARRLYFYSRAYWFMGRSRITCATCSSFSTRRGREIPRLHPRNYKDDSCVSAAHPRVPRRPNQFQCEPSGPLNRPCGLRIRELRPR